MKITREFLRSLNFSVMSDFDRQGFAGAESPVTLMAEFDEKFLVILDGDYCEIVDVFELQQIEVCENIRALPY